MHTVCSGLHMQLSFIALHGNAESVFKSCLTLRGLGDNCKLLSPFSVTLTIIIGRIKVFQGLLCNSTTNNSFVLYLVKIQSIVLVVDLVLTLSSFQIAQSEYKTCM